MIMALLIDLLLRGGKFFTLAARRTLWQMFESNECGPRIILDHENLLKLARTTDTIHFGKDKDIQTSAEVISSRKEYVKHASVGDNCKINPQPEDVHELKKLDSLLDSALNSLDKAMPKHNSDGSLDKLLEELERKVREVEPNEPVVLPVSLSQKIANNGDSFSSLQGCISKFRVEEREAFEPILHSKPAKRTKYLKSSISDDLHIKLGKSRKYFKRITEHFSMNNNHTHNSLPDLTTPTALSFYSCRSLHTRIESRSRLVTSGTILRNPPEKKVNLEDAAIREMLDKKMKLLAEKKDKRKKKNSNKSEVKERERLLEINQQAFKKVEDDLKTVKIIEKSAIKRQFADVDQLLSLLDDNPKINFLKNMKIHKELPRYDNTASAEFVVRITPKPATANNNVSAINIIKKSGPNKLNLLKLQEEIETNYKQSDNSVKALVQFMKYEQIPRICHLNENTFGQAISAELLGYVESKRPTNALLINRKWETLNQIKLQEEIVMRNSPLLKFTVPQSYGNVRTMKTIDENVELEMAATEILETGKDGREELVAKLGVKVANVTDETGKETKRAEKSQMSLEKNVQTTVMEHQKKVFRQKMKAKKNVGTKTKELVKMLVRPISAKRLGRKGSKTKKIEEFVVPNAKSVVQGKIKAELLDAKTDLIKDFKVVDMGSLVVKEKSADEPKATEKIGQQGEKIVKHVKTARTKKSKVKQKASAVDTIAKTLVDEAEPQKKAVENKLEIIKTTECGGKNEQTIERTENLNSTVLAVHAECFEEDLQTVTKAQVLENQDQLQSEASKSSKEGKCCEKEVKAVTERNMQNAEGKAMPKAATENDTLQEPVALAECSELKTYATEIEQVTVTEKVHAEPTKPLKIASSKLEMIQEPEIATSILVKLQVKKSKEKMPENQSDCDKIKTDLVQNLLPGSSMAKSRIPVRRAHGECTEAMEAANKTIHKMVSEYQIEKQGTLIPKGGLIHRKKLRLLQKIGTKRFKPSKTPIKEDVEDVDDAPIQLNEKQSVVKELKDSASDMLKKLLNKKSGELKADGKSGTDINIENEMPPDFDIIKDVDLVDIPMDDDERLEVPAETKNTVEHSEKSLEHVKYCSDINKERELVALLLDNQNLEVSTPKELNFVLLKPQKEIKRTIQTIKEEESDEWTDLVDTTNEYSTQHGKTNDNELRNSAALEQNEGKHKNLLNNVPVNMSTAQSFATMSKYTFWNRQPKTEENPDTGNSEKEEQSKTKQEGSTKQQKKYKMVTDEIEAIGGGKIKVTKLVEDV